MWEEHRRVRTSDRGGPVDLTLLSGRRTCRTTAVPEQARQEGSEEGRERAQETRNCTSTGRQGKGTQAGG